jgi:integrase
MSGPAELWMELLPRCEDRTKAAGYRRDYCFEILKILAESHPDLYSGKAGAELTVAEATALVDILKKNTPGHVLKHKISYLVRGLEKGVIQLGWDAAVPHPPVIIPRDRPRLTYEDFQRLPDYYEIEKTFLANLTKDAPETPSARVGQLLLSSVLFGGLVEKRWMIPWIQALPSPQCFHSTLWLDMVLTNEHLKRERKNSRKKTAQEFKSTHSSKRDWKILRRWFADPLTQILILRWYEKFPADRNEMHRLSPLLAIKHYLEGMLPSSFKVTESLISDLLSGAATRLGLSVPPFLMAYAEGRIKSVSLPPLVWHRLLTGQRTVNNKALIEEPLPIEENIPNITSGQVVAPAIQEQLLRKILSEILPRETHWKQKQTEVRSALKLFYEDHSEKINQTLACLIHWCSDMLIHCDRKELIRGRKKSKLRPSSVRTYLDTVGKRLISVAGDLDILDLEGDELHDVYSKVINLCRTQKATHATGWRLVAFHQFLVIRCGAPAVDFSDITESSDPAETGVDANLITPLEFDRVKKLLAPNFGKASRLRKIQYFSAILGFRCGLRRSEIRKLRLIDLQGHAEPVVLVRNNQYANVKSEESIRRLPLATLLESEELSLLLAWHNERKIEDGGTNQYSLLFCQAAEPTQRLEEYDVFPLIEKAMREVIGDLSLRFHHFRHSFAAWLLLRLQNIYTDDVVHQFEFMKHDIFKEEACHKIRVALLGNHRLGRQVLYAVAQLCGHASPQVTLLHYIHLCDWLLAQGLLLPDNQPSLDVKTIAAMTNVKQNIIYYKAKHNQACKLSLFVDKLIIPEDLKPIASQPDPAPLNKLIQEKNGDCSVLETIPLWHRVEAVFRDRHLNKLTSGELAIRHRFAERELRNWCANAEMLSAMKTKMGKPMHMNTVTLKKNPLSQFPVPIHLHADREMADKVITFFENFRVSKKKVLYQGVSCFLEHYCASQSAVLFSASSGIKSFIKFLRLIVPAEQIRVRRVMPSTSRRSHASERTSLANDFSLPYECINVINLHPTQSSRNGEIHIQVLNTSNGCKGGERASYGFRYAMYMVGIIYGLPKTNVHSNKEERGAV